MARHEYGTLFPTDLSAVANKAEELMDAGWAIYEVKVELDDGAWRVDYFVQDEDLATRKFSYGMDLHGGMATSGRVTA